MLLTTQNTVNEFIIWAWSALTISEEENVLSDGKGVTGY